MTHPAMTHLAIAPVVVPALAGVLHLALARAGAGLHRALALAAVAALAAAAALLLAQAAGQEAPSVYRIGGYAPPYGIVLVLDRLSALVLAAAAAVGAGTVAAAVAGPAQPSPHVLALFQFELMGVDGAVLSGDLFNLYVFFEVLLTASYGLLVLGEAARHARTAFDYIVINLLESTLFLVAVALVYGATGTLNLADLAVAVAGADAATVPLLRTAGMLLLAVLVVKAAAMPLHLRLSPAAGPAGPAVAGLFAILTAVCVYALVRVFTLLFGALPAEAAGPAAGLAHLARPWLLPAGLVVLAGASVAALGAARPDRLAVHLLMASVGLVLAAFGLFTPAGIAAGLYQLVHGAAAAGALFLLAGAARDGRAAGRPAAALVVAGLALVGLPPLAGFVGKALLLDAAPALWAPVLGSALAGLLACARLGVAAAAPGPGPGAPPPGPPGPPPGGAAALGPAAGLLALSLLLAAFAGPVDAYLRAAAGALLAPRGYIAAVLGPDGLARLP